MNVFTCLARCWLLFAALSPFAFAAQPCRIEVVEKESGWPVPLVELRTTHHARFVTDNAGVIAFDSPELMGRETWFDVSGHGYEVPKDGFGSRGVLTAPRQRRDAYDVRGALRTARPTLGFMGRETDTALSALQFVTFDRIRRRR